VSNSRTVRLLRKNLLLQFLSDDQWYGTEDHWVLVSRNQGRTWKKLCKLEPPESWLQAIRDIVLRSDVVHRFRKNIGIHNLVVLDSGSIIIQYDKVYRFDYSGRHAVPVYDFHQQGVNGPLKNGLCYDENTGNLYFGEYIIKRPSSVRIIRGRDDGRTWEICHCFARGAVRHVHGIYSDPYRSRIWICTGDNDDESGLYYTDDDFETVHLFGAGDQSWRMVSLLITENSLIWGTDAGQDAPAHVRNYIYHLDLRTGIRKRLCCIDKPAYYSLCLADGSMYIATTYEPGTKRNVTRSADLWHSIDGWNWEIVQTFPYQLAGRDYGTKYATLFLPICRGRITTFCCTPVNVKSYDFNAIQVE